MIQKNTLSHKKLEMGCGNCWRVMKYKFSDFNSSYLDYKAFASSHSFFINFYHLLTKDPLRRVMDVVGKWQMTLNTYLKQERES